MAILPENRDKIVNVKLSQILARKNWNGRSGAWEENDGTEEDNQFNQLVESIEAGMDAAGSPNDITAGQDTPVTLRINTGTMSETFPYELVQGFRRHRAATVIGVKRTIADPEVRAIIKRVDDVDARFENISENTARKDLSPADQCWSIKDLLKVAKANSVQLSGNQIAKRIGRDQTWVAKLVKLANGLRVEVLEKWRLCPAKISVENMLTVAQLSTKEEQMNAFNALVRVDTEEEGGSGGEGQVSSWIETKKKRIAELGAILGELERQDLINTGGLDFDSHVDLLVKLPSKATANNRRSIAAAGRKAWQAAKDRVVEEDDEDESEDVTPRKRSRE